MKITVVKDKLKDILATVERIAGKRTGLAILNNFFIKAKGSAITILATDLELGYQGFLPGKIEQEGEAVIPVKHFVNFVNHYPEDILTIVTQDDTLGVTSSRSRVKLPSLPTDEFPIIPQVERDRSLVIPTDILEHACAVLLPCLTSLDIKPELNGIYFWFTQDEVSFVATDSFRLSEITFPRSRIETSIQETSHLLSKQFIQEYRALRGKGDSTTFFFANSQIGAETGDHFLSTRVIDVEYPNYRDVIPQTADIELVVSKNELLTYLRLNKVFTSKLNEVRIHIKEDARLSLSSKNELVGESMNTIQVTVNKNERDGLSISFNVDFLISAVEAFASEEVLLGFTSTDRPLVITPPTKRDHVTIIMPLHDT